MSTHTFNTLEAVSTVHRGMRMIDHPDVVIGLKNLLRQQTDAVLSFTAYYLRYENPECRPEQLHALASLQHLVKQLETKYGIHTPKAA